jgi:hypothetical protein
MPISVFTSVKELTSVTTVSGITLGSSVTAQGASSIPGLALALNFLNTTSLDTRVTFSRGTNATLIDSTGLLTYAPSNQILNSESFVSTSIWPRTFSNVTSNATVAPDGTTTADKLLADGTAGALHYIASAISGQSGVNYTYSLYVKAAELSQVAILIPTAIVGATTQVIFDTATNPASVIGTVGSPLWSNITAVGNGWYRVAMGVAATATTSGGAQIKLVKAGSATFDGNGTDGIYIWGAQFGAMTYETAPRAYNSTTPKNLLGLTEEFDRVGWGKVNATIQTNLLLYSEQLDVAATWVGPNVTITVNDTIAPNGTTTADKIVETTSTTTHQITQTTAFVSGTEYTWSIFVKAAERSVVRVLFPAAAFTSNLAVNFDIAAGAWRTSSPTPPAQLTLFSQDAGNGWYRISATATATASVSSTILLMLVDSPSGNGSYTGNGTFGLYAWGAQMVQGATAGNYQQTLAAVAAVQYTDPNGYLNADKLVEDTSANYHYVSGSNTVVSGTVYTISCYAKAAENNFINIQSGGPAFAGSAGVSTNLTTGQQLGYNGATGFGATDVGNGWWRIYITITAAASATGSALILTSKTLSSNATYLGDGTSGAYIWGAQLSDSASVDPYVYNPAAALTSTAYYGPRFEYDPAFTYSTNNLIPYANPQDFNNGSFWPRARATVPATTATADPTGSETAYKFTENVSVTPETHVMQWQGVGTSVITGVQYTFSGYAKAAERTALVLAIGPDNGAFTTNGGNVDLITGAVSGVTGAAPIVTNVGNGWWRWSITATATASALCVLRVQLIGGGTNSYVGDGTSGAYIWGAQLTASAAAVPFYYYSRTPNPLGLLIEEARTNLIFPSDATGWSMSPVSIVAITANSAISPDGTTNATKLTTNDATLADRGYAIFKLYSGTINTTYCGSAYLKAGEYTRAQINFENTSFSTPTGALFDLANGTVVVTGGGSTATITPVGNGWYRCTVTATSLGTSLNYVFSASFKPASVTTFNSTYIPVSTGLGGYIYGAQVEAGGFATSFIPTASSQVIRSADVATMVGNNFTNWYKQTTGTLAASFDTSASSNASYVSASNGNIAQNSVHIDNDITSGLMRAVYYSAGSAVATLNLSATGTVGATNKVATAYAVNDFAASRNGGTVATGTGALPIALTQLNIGTDDRLVAPYYTNNHIKSISYYNTRLPDTQLQAITA